MSATIAEEAARELEGTNLQDIAISIAVVVSVVIFAIINVLYMLFAAFLERRFFAASRLLPLRQSAGVLFLVMACISVPTQLLCLIFGWPTVPRNPFYFAYRPRSGHRSIAVFGRLAGLGMARIVVVFLMAGGLLSFLLTFQ